MSKLYVFGIGGTGSRVLKSLTMLLASGVDCKDDIVPIIIDPDASAGNLTETTELLKKYIYIKSKIGHSESEGQFFKTKIEETVPYFTLPLTNTQDIKFQDYIELRSMTKECKALTSALFSEKNLESDMRVGFKGNPNIGSVVLNQFAESKEFINNFANDFKPDDKIFIISSIFGGTGASGFPLLLKTLRSNETMPNANIINNAVIGAVTVLPYFGVETDNESSIDSSTFISKTKSALRYYEENISKNVSIDYLYYLSDRKRTNYKNCEGGVSQRNEAHLIELCAALAILDFSKNAEKQTNTEHKEFGIKKDVDAITFNDLGDKTKRLVKKSLIQTYIFYKFLTDSCNCSTKEYEKQPWGKDNKFTEDFFESNFIESLKFFYNKFNEWLTEMQNQNSRKFKPFRLDSDDPVNSVEGKEVKYGIFSSKGYSYITSELNSVNKKGLKTEQDEGKFMSLVYAATENIVNEKHKE